MGNEQFATAFGQLPGAQLSPTQTPGPVRRQHAVRGAGDRIFRNTYLRCKKPGHKVHLNTGCGDNDTDAVESGTRHSMEAKANNE